MDKTYFISADALTLERIAQILQDGHQIALSDERRHRIRHCRDYLTDKLKHSDELFYGINTGFGSLCNIMISKEETEACSTSWCNRTLAAWETKRRRRSYA